MGAKSWSMTEGSLAKGILRFSAPLMLTNVLQVLFNMSDVAVVGRFAGASALGSVGSTTILVTLFIGLIQGMGAAVNVTVARFLGAREECSVRQSVHTSALLCLITGLLVMTVGLLLGQTFLTMMHTREELLEGAVLYLRIFFLGMPGLALFNFGSAVLSAAGDTKRPLMIMSGCGVLNVALNLLLVIVCGMGVAGVAIASAVSQTVSAVLVLRILLRSGESYALRPGELRLTGSMVSLILPMGIASGFQFAIFAFANLFVQAGVNSFDTVIVEGTAAASNADNLVYDVMAAFYTACTSFMGQNYGAGNRERVLKSYYISMAYAFVIGLGMGLTICALGRPFLSLFTTEEAVVEAGLTRLTIMSISYGFSAFMDCTIAALRGLGHSFGPMLLELLGACVFRLIWIATIFAHFRTIESLYLLYVCSWTVTALAEIVYFVPCWRKAGILMKCA